MNSRIEKFTFTGLTLILFPAVWLSGCARIQKSVKEEQHRQQALLRNNCQGQLSQLSLALMQYRADHDDRFPVVASAGQAYGWADALKPYGASPQLFQCPTEPTPFSADPASAGYTDYWFNSNLSGVREKAVSRPVATILFGEGGTNDVTNARYAKSSLPKVWITDAGSPAKRHLGGSVYAYADGHTASSKPESLLTKAYGDGKQVSKFGIK
jgi:prepilin-type processing-associated H-X9-DG protein